MSEFSESLTGLEIAVIGMSCRFPGAGNISQYWENLKNGVESITFFSEEELIKTGVKPKMLENPNYIKARGLLSGSEYFDSSFFGYSSREAEIMDPQMRIFHEIAWEALEDSGYAPEGFEGLIGFYGGAAHNHNWIGLSTISGKSKEIGFWAANQLIDKSYLTMRISYKLNLRGPSFSMYTACSTSLVSIHVACQAILNGECDMALAGGITLILPANTGYMFQEGMIMSPDGHCRVFAANAAGTIGGEGGGIVVLKRLEDAITDRDHIYAVVKGSAVNNDGIRKSGFTAPSVEGQVEVIGTAQQMAQVKPETIGFVETHGTGTPIGDPIEIEALILAFNTREKNFCALGSVKSNFGHLDAAAGIAGFIKAVLAITHRLIPPSLHFENPNPQIDFINSPFYVNTELKEWKNERHPLRAGVSSFGIGGTNSHVVLEDWSGGSASTGKCESQCPASQSREYQLILLSAKTETALQQAMQNLALYLSQNPGINFNDASYTLQAGRQAFRYRCMLVAPNREETIRLLTSAARLDSPAVGQGYTGTAWEKNHVIFLFSGLGSQYVDMGRDLYEKEAVFAREMNRCFEILSTLVDDDIKEILYPRDSLRDEKNKTEGANRANVSRINRTEIAQIVVFIFEYALAKLFIRWGIKPHAMIGYSFGEYTAACISGVFSLEDALRVVVARGRLIRQLPPGSMLSVPLSRNEIDPYLNHELALAIDNGDSCIISGPGEAINAFENEMKKKKKMCMPVPSTHALHSGMMEPILTEFEKIFHGISLHQPQIPYISNVTGYWQEKTGALTPSYWSKHLSHTVCFADGIRVLLKKANSIFIEIGPGHDISTLIHRHLEKNKNKEHLVLNPVRPAHKNVSDIYYLLSKIGLIWVHGQSINWKEFYWLEKPRRVSLPTYPFERQYFWIEMNPAEMAANNPKSSIPERKQLADRFYLPSWKSTIKPLTLTNGDLPPDKRKWLVFTDECELGKRILQKLKLAGISAAVVKKGKTFSKNDDGDINKYTINPGSEQDYDRLLNHLARRGQAPEMILHLWSLTRDIPSRTDLGIFEECQQVGYYSLIFLTRALEKHGLAPVTVEATKEKTAKPVQLMVAANHLFAVTGASEEEICPGKTTILGPCKTIPLEYPSITCRIIDVVLPGSCKDHEYNQLVNQLTAEFFYRDSRNSLVAYRGNTRWIQWFEPLHLEQKPMIPHRLKQAGVYLITGGLGKDSLVRAKYLAARVKARLVLTARTALPPREEWEEWLKTHDQENAVSEKIEKLMELEKLGAQVRVMAADAADEEQMHRIINEIDREWGTLDGVIHASGITSLESSVLISKLGYEESQWHFRPKVHGLYVLKKVLEGRKLDFCLLTSSILSILGGGASSAYTAASNFMDAFAAQQHYHGNQSWISLNWEGASPEDTVEAFHRVLTLGPLPQLTVSNFNLDMRIQHRRQQSHSQRKKPVRQSKKYKRPHLMSSYKAPVNDTGKKLVEIWENLLGFQPVGIEDDFFELGGDSLKAIVAIANIHKDLHVEVSIKEFFDHPTIGEFAVYIERKSTTSYSAVEPVEKKGYYTLSAQQKRLYILQKMEPGSTAYNETRTVWLEGEINGDKIQTLLEKLIRRHEIYRTSVKLIGDRLFQKVHPYEEIDFNIDYHEAAVDEARQLVNGFVKPFDLSQPPLLRILLIKVSPLKHILVLDIHHIITDLTSDGIFVKEFMTLYKDKEKELPLLSLHYKDYAEWQNRETQQKTFESQANYWLQKFSGEIPVLRLPTDFPRPPLQNFEGSALGFNIDQTRGQALKKLALKENVTLYMVLLSILYILLWKLSGQEDIVIGTPVAGRRRGELQQLMGIFINTLALRNRPSKEKNFTRFLQEIRQDTLAAFDNQDYPFEDLVDKIMVNRDLSRSPLFDILFTLQNIEQRPDRVLKGETLGIKLATYRNDLFSTKFDLTLMIFESNNRFSCSWYYCTKLFKKETIKRFSTYFLKILDTITSAGNIPLQHLDILPKEEMKLVLYEFNNTTAGYPREKNLCQLLVEQARKRPDQIALVAPMEQLAVPNSQLHNNVIPQGKFINPDRIQISYRELNEKSNQLVYILKEKNVRTNSIVGIAVQRSWEMLIGLWGILKSGAAYLPIDPDFPRQRIRFMLADSSANVLVTSRSLVKDELMGSPEERKNLEMVFLDFPTPSHPVDTELDIPASALAYVIYTSGSTGKPKGVAVRHQNAVNFIGGMKRIINFSPGKIILALTTVSFDIFFLETLLPVTCGMRVVIADEEQQKDPVLLTKLIITNQVNMLQLTPSRLQLFLSSTNGRGCLSGISELIVGGEAFPAQLFADLQAVFPGKIYNVYGPTETTIWSTVKDLTRITPAELNIGTPIINTRIYIVNSDYGIQPIGVAGELLIGGDGVAVGYLNKPTLTSEKFLLKPGKYYRADRSSSSFIPSKVYKTGDLARWLTNGEIEFLGRLDHQVKIRGYRIELEEIEMRLVKHEAIKEALVIAGEESGESGNQNKFLCAYIVVEQAPEEDDLSASQLREYLSRYLPEYMIPSHFIPLDAFPLTPNNKVDRKALPGYQQQRLQAATAYAAPGTDYEKYMAQLWQEILKLDKVGIHDNFFELGGNSLKLIQLNARLNEALGLNISVMTLFRYPTIHSLLTFWEVGEKDISIIDKQIQDSRSDLEESMELLTGMIDE